MLYPYTSSDILYIYIYALSLLPNLNPNTIGPQAVVETRYAPRAMAESSLPSFFSRPVKQHRVLD